MSTPPIPASDAVPSAPGDGGADADSAAGESVRTVVVAVAANLAIAVAKAVAAVITGSASLWAETAHSFADTGNEVLLFIGLRRSDREADARHPFGYGQERWFWAFLAAMGIFVVGGVLAIQEGIKSLLHPEALESVWVGVAVLLVSAVLEGISWRQAHKQLKAEAARNDRTLARQLKRGSDPTAATVFLEDSAALIGLALALAALGLHAWTGSAVWDAVSSILIGLLLVAVAWRLATRNKALLIDESAPPNVLENVREGITSDPWVADAPEVTAVFVGPRLLLVSARVVATREAADAPAERLTEAVAGLTARLEARPGIARADIVVVPASNPASAPDPSTAP
ncbi:cation diffusion facilitator family transporter [Yinghuangia soli]|uniref:Cation diffusion facilitator family transporter n=1 Tax=Yinghuangia soli TaxID=2908204 RepID=A0AA41U403_9ACTN|nr:cation diffusion facilitator family transporter [Yinghuangia soli]MCF2532365.1 cation diffusion facilitator family transporter [Yinghuangia soli]